MTKWNGCPRHLSKPDRSCQDIRCLLTWEPPNAPTPDEQLARWVIGDAVCPNTRHECCPDFACCKPNLAWSREAREKFVAASQGEREKMMMGSLTALSGSVSKKAYVTRGDPNDQK